METMHEIEKKVTQLSSMDLAKFREWFENYDAGVWDKQFEDDADSGRLNRIAERAVSDFNTGRATEL